MKPHKYVLIYLVEIIIFSLYYHQKNLFLFLEKFDFRMLFVMCPIFVGTIDNVGRFDDDLVKK